MSISSLFPARDTRLLLCLGTGAAVVCLGVGAWLVAAQKQPEVKRTSLVVEPPQAGAHLTGKVHFDLLAKLLGDDRRSAPANDWLRELADSVATIRFKTQTHPLLYLAAPEFTLADHHGQPWSLHGQLKRGPVVLVFYLGYACNACVHDLCELNADLERFHCLGTEVVAVSGDTPELTQQRFLQYGAFGFPVLSDPGHIAAQSYGTFRQGTASKPEELLHATFLVGRDRKLHWVHRGDTPFRGNKALWYELARLENKLPQQEPTIEPIDKEPIDKEPKTP
ncbi:MAG: redoxin domain-containing protein [Planctomycetes bacterium]|nr:redoxin domain-containing protein [Planctomycetota bacterium]